MTPRLVRLLPVAAGLLFVPPPAAAEVVVAARTIPVRTVLSAADLATSEVQAAGAATRPEDLVGLETRVPLYAGRPVHPADVGPPAVIERNEIVTLRYSAGGLVIETAGRALDRAAPGTGIRVMNLSSRMTVIGRATAGGIVEVGQ